MAKLVYYLTSLISKLQKIKGGGTSFPGKVALRLKPDILGEFKIPEQRVFISGTNGKTSTANYLADVLRQAGQSVCHNTAGANLKQGIVSSLLQSSDSNLRIKSDALVIEIDELTMLNVFPELNPQHLILTNLFTDQIDRFGDKWQLAKTLSEKLPHGLTLFINGDDPVLVWLSQQIKPERVVYYGLTAEYSAGDAKVKFQSEKCPYCNSELSYERRYYDSLGKFNCKCGFKSPELNYIAENIDLPGREFIVKNQVYQMMFPQLYLVYNMLAAIAYAQEADLSADLIAQALSEQTETAGRFEFLDFNKYQAWLNLVKNPAGINQSLVYLNQQLTTAGENKQQINLMLAFNNMYADGLDSSWLEQAEFELLRSENLAALYLAGSLQKKVCELLKESGIPENKIYLIPEQEQIVQAISEMQQSDLPGYFLANFTMLEPVRTGILKSIK
ncbi:MAG: MurT ligase domain-containing protein [Saccharofermentanales bacterium]